MRSKAGDSAPGELTLLGILEIDFGASPEPVSGQPLDIDSSVATRAFLVTNLRCCVSWGKILGGIKKVCQLCDSLPISPTTERNDRCEILGVVTQVRQIAPERAKENAR
jgi:hypothetical protein